MSRLEARNVSGLRLSERTLRSENQADLLSEESVLTLPALRESYSEPLLKSRSKLLVLALLTAELGLPSSVRAFEKSTEISNSSSASSEDQPAPPTIDRAVNPKIRHLNSIERSFQDPCLLPWVRADRDNLVMINRPKDQAPESRHVGRSSEILAVLDRNNINQGTLLLISPKESPFSTFRRRAISDLKIIAGDPGGEWQTISEKKVPNYSVLANGQALQVPLALTGKLDGHLHLRGKASTLEHHRLQIDLAKKGDSKELAVLRTYVDRESMGSGIATWYVELRINQEREISSLPRVQGVNAKGESFNMLELRISDQSDPIEINDLQELQPTVGTFSFKAAGNDKPVSLVVEFDTVSKRDFTIKLGEILK